MTCKRVERELLTLDQYARPSKRVEAHLQRCPKCRRLAEAVGSADAELRLIEKADPEIVDSVMLTVEQSGARPRRSESLAGWLFGALLLVAAMVAVRQSIAFRFLLGSVLGPRVDLSVTVAIGIGLVAYLGVFVLAKHEHLEELAHRLLGEHGPGHR